jgi:hypothetical protein
MLCNALPGLEVCIVSCCVVLCTPMETPCDSNCVFRPRKKLDFERVVYCGIERCFFEVSIDKGLFRYQLSKHLVTTDSTRNAPPCPPDLAKTMASI